MALFLTNDSEHAGGFGGLCITFIFSLIFKHRLVDDEDVLATLCDNFVLLSLSDFTSVLEPADLRGSREEEVSEKDSPRVFTVYLERQKLCSP